MRIAVMLAMFSLFGVGCSVPESAIVGTWVANPSRVKDPSVAKLLSKSLSGSITFRPDKTYQCSTRLEGSTHAESGKWRIAGNEVFFQRSELDPEWSLGLHGNDLIGYALFGDLGVPFERKPQGEETSARQH